jgi:hypothetical protein
MPLEQRRKESNNATMKGTSIFPPRFCRSVTNSGVTYMHKLILAAGLIALASPAFAADYYIVQNPTTKVCTITEERPAGGGIVVGTPFGARVEAETHMKTVKECTESTSGSGGGKVIEEKREQRVR